MAHKTIQERIRSYLAEKGMTQRQFAYEVGIAVSCVEAWMATPGTKNFREPNKLQENAIRYIIKGAGSGITGRKKDPLTETKCNYCQKQFVLTTMQKNRKDKGFSVFCNKECVKEWLSAKRAKPDEFVFDPKAWEVK